MIELLISQLISCITTGNFTPEPCVEILNQIVEERTMETNPNHYTIWIVWFPYNSDANEVANYWYDQSHWDLDMIATFIAEANFNKDAVGKAGEKWICQLLPNRTNNKWINDERWNDIMFQAEVCVDKRLAVPKPSKIRYGWKNREKMKKRIYFFEDAE